MRGYDQWKTASPYDDDPDWVEESEKFIKHHKGQNQDDDYVCCLLEGLLEIMRDEGIL